MGSLKGKIRRLGREITSPIKGVARRIAGPGDIAKYHHVKDGMATVHIDRFDGTPGFAPAYARAVKAAGWDYGIPYRIHQTLWCAAQARKVPGDIVELGTGRGFMMSAALEAWPDWASSERSMYLFDTYEAGYIHPKGGGKRTEPSPYYARSYEIEKANFAEWDRVHLIQGDVFETIPTQPITQVAFLHIDLNFYKPEIFGLHHFWPMIPVGGVVLLDDYAFRNHEQQYDAMNEAAKGLGVSILSTASGQGIIIK